MLWRRGVLDGRESLRPAGTMFEARLLRNAVNALLEGLSGGRFRLVPSAGDDAPTATHDPRLELKPKPRPYGMPDSHPLVVRKVYA